MPCFLTSHTLAIPLLCRSTSIMAEKPRLPPAPPVVHRAFVPHLIGSLVQRELAAVRLTEGLTRQSSHRCRYLQPLRQKSEIFAAAPCTGEALAARRSCGVNLTNTLPAANLPQNGKRPCRNGQTGRDVSIGEMELEKGIIMLLGGEIACFVSGRRGSCAVTKIPACYLTVPII